MVVAQYIRMLRRRPLSVELIVLGINFNLAFHSNDIIYFLMYRIIFFILLEQI